MQVTLDTVEILLSSRPAQQAPGPTAPQPSQPGPGTDAGWLDSLPLVLLRAIFDLQIQACTLAFVVLAAAVHAGN